MDNIKLTEFLKKISTGNHAMGDFFHITRGEVTIEKQEISPIFSSYNTSYTITPFGKYKEESVYCVENGLIDLTCNITDKGKAELRHLLIDNVLDGGE